jgi:hypothetical protein
MSAPAPLPLYGGPSSWTSANPGGAYTFDAHQGFLQTAPFSMLAPAGTLFGAPFEVDLLGGARGTRQNNLWVWSYIWMPAPGVADADPASWIEGEFAKFMAAVSPASGYDTGTLAIYLADLSGTKSAAARFMDATVSADTRAWGGLTAMLIFRLKEDPH